MLNQESTSNPDIINGILQRPLIEEPAEDPNLEEINTTVEKFIFHRFQEIFDSFGVAPRAFEIIINIKKTGVLFQPKRGMEHTQDLNAMIDNIHSNE
ncbi:Hypothetical predicted protein [Octopus vulgaris]|uniref:Uncharacterized protein n=1 Tax=Octopus vulgaris TaxID=6645 RepID=A0AA36FE75_OCTVU|nr:Hypothetical predicted protein [Octopus vulgaris]